MKIDIMSKEETHRIRDISLNIQVEESGKLHKLTVIMIEEYDSKHKSFNYEVASFGWITSQKEVNVRAMETKIEEYLIDNAEDILS
jgi:hypothetical protein